MIGEDLRHAVLAREDVRRLFEPPDGDPSARARVDGYLEELRATQRHSIYRALKHPLYPILRKVERIPEGLPHLRKALDTGRVVYVSNHKSHLDYLIELLILEDHELRPPIIAAGINLFGGALGLLHKHVTGAIPIRRGARDAAYLVTLKAFVAELLETHDLFFYPEGGRSYSGELKTAKTGLFNAVVLAEVPVLHIVPVAIAYDLVLEDKILAPQVTKSRQRPFTRELAEMVGTAVGYQSRAFVSFGAPVTLAGGGEARSRRDVMDLAQQVLGAVGRLHKVLPTALIARAMRPSITRRELVSRIAELVGELKAVGANLDLTDASAIVAAGLPLLEERGVLALDGDVIRVRDRFVLRYYARQLQHLLGPARPAARA
ncbi:MAG TPA: 1-acyl-sn-glycerol-3-phosphate acyltransferase [Luteitalea sp.]|nr:1-acyl-sn-glycerol-3-phosphate acyltransferase [Luteitalea sp.]